MATFDVNLKVLFFLIFFIGITVEAQEPNLKQRIKRQAVRYQLWPRGVVPYKFGSIFYGSPTAKDKILEAIKELSAKTCIKFKERAYEIDFVEFIGGIGCWSYVGHIGGKQLLSIGRGCGRKGVVMHEIAHALGFYHEQSRPDRDGYVKIMWDNIYKGMTSQFRKLTTGMVDTMGQPYDYGSVLHYGPRAFTKNGKKTIIVTKPGVTTMIGQRSHLSVQDIKDINILYKCVVDGEWSTWAKWSACSVDCGIGKKTRTHKCTDPAPSYGGKDCSGDNFEVTDCQGHDCFAGRCSDSDSHKWCPFWSSLGFCSPSKGKENYDYMMKNCRRSCLCKLICRDDKTGVAAGKCSYWRSRGFCVHPRYGDYVRTYCKMTCRQCPT